MAQSLKWHDSDLETQLRNAGLHNLLNLAGDLDEPLLAALAEAPSPLTRARTRRLYVLPPLLGESPRLFIKLQVAHGHDLPPRKWLSYTFKPSPLIREARAAESLSKIGLRTPTLVASGSNGSFPCTVRAVLITRAESGYIDLETLLSRSPSQVHARSSVSAVEATIARVHATGFALGGARFRDFLVPTSGASSLREVMLLDVVNFGRGSKRRVRDLKQFEQERARFSAD